MSNLLKKYGSKEKSILRKKIENLKTSQGNNKGQGKNTDNLGNL